MRGKVREVLVETAERMDRVRRLIAREEGMKPYAYKDSAGKWTIGVGHLILPTEPELMNYTKESPAPMKLVHDLFERDVSDAKGTVKQFVKVPLTDSQYAALVSLVFNIGSGNFRNSTLLKKLNAGDYAGAAAEFPAWRYATVNGEKKPILLARREREKQEFIG